MAAPVVVPHTWPRNSAWQLHPVYDDYSVTPKAPMTTGTVVLVVKDAAGAILGTFNGTHVANGEWQVNVSALNQTKDSLGEFILTATKSGNTDERREWLKFSDPPFPLAP